MGYGLWSYYPISGRVALVLRQSPCVAEFAVHKQERKWEAVHRRFCGDSQNSRSESDAHRRTTGLLDHNMADQPTAFYSENAHALI